MRLPSSSPITLRFGATTDPYSKSEPHLGVDFAYIPDNKIYAPFTGTVILRPNNGRDGNGIYMYNSNQFHGLLHSSQYLVKDGQNVQEGQPIGVMGDTGFAQGIHLHWCVKINNQFVNPLALSGLIQSIKERPMADTPLSEQIVNDRLAARRLWEGWYHETPTTAQEDNLIGKKFIEAAAWLDNQDKRRQLDALIKSGGQINHDTALAYVQANLK